MALSIGNTANSGVLATSNGTTFSLNNDKEDVIVLVALRDTRTAGTPTVTYGGAAMTEDKAQLHTDADPGTADLRCHIFRKTGAATGANDVVVTFSNTVDHAAVFAVALGGASATGQPDVTGGGNADQGALTDPSVAVITTDTDTIIFDVVYHKDSTDLTATAGQTIIAQLAVNGGGDTALAGYEIVASANTYTQTYDATNFDDWCMVVVAYKIAAGGGGSAIKTVNGLVKASVKTVNGLAIASVKSINGLQ